MRDADSPLPVVAGRGASLRLGVRRAEPIVWLSAAAVVVAIAALSLLLLLLASRGLAHFWPQPLLLLELEGGGRGSELGQLLQRESAPGGGARLLLYRGGGAPRDATIWVPERSISARSHPPAALVVELREAAPLFGFAVASGAATDAAGSGLAGVRVWGTLPGLAIVAGRLQLRLANGELRGVALSDIQRLHAPNAMTLTDRIGYFGSRLAQFLLDSPQRVNAAGGVFPAIVGTVMLVLLMSIAVTPLGILAAIFLQEYAPRGILARLVRIAVNNLAGVPSIVYGVFGLGFFVYQIGGSLDQLLFSASLPAPTLGTPGLLWASLTMALLTLPVVIVATEEGLARVPQSLREGSLALGATRAETLWRVVLPAASPALLTGLILAVARATGEVAPLILVGVAKYAPVLPVSGEFPWLHLDRQFMHLGFHIFDLGFQSPNLQHAAGRVYATALLLVLIVLLLNLSAVILRSRLREAFKAQDLF
jgi:phosphate transport system permease protein